MPADLLTVWCGERNFYLVSSKGPAYPFGGMRCDGPGALLTWKGVGSSSPQCMIGITVQRLEFKLEKGIQRTGLQNQICHVCLGFGFVWFRFLTCNFQDYQKANYMYFYMMKHNLLLILELAPLSGLWRRERR